VRPPPASRRPSLARRTEHASTHPSPSYRQLLFVVDPPPPTATLFPYTTLFRSPRARSHRASDSRAMGQRRRQRSAPRFDDCGQRSEEHTSELQSPCNLVCRLLLEKKKRRTRPDSSPLSSAARSYAHAAGASPGP